MPSSSASSKRAEARSGAAAQPRLRVLAGPNGSGKSTIQNELKPEWIGVFVNADEISVRIHASRLNPWFVETELWRSFS